MDRRSRGHSSHIVYSKDADMSSQTPPAATPPADTGRTIFFSAGDPSGDVHAAHLIRDLERRGGIKAVGYGGPKMAEAGCELHFKLTTLAVMGLSRALLIVHKFWWLYRKADRYFARQRPDAVVLVDFPGFNWWIAKAAKRHGIPVFYYAPPQVWGWAQWRVKKMRRYVDHVLCSLPFEQQWFAERGCNATYVGHPFFEEVRRHEMDEEFIDQQAAKGGRVLLLLPGSRTQEVEHNLRRLYEAARIVQASVGDVRLAVAAFKPAHAEAAIRLAGQMDLDIDIQTGRTPEMIYLSHCCLAVSGSVSLELLYHGKPTVINYQIGRLGFEAQRYFRKIKYITLVNLLACDRLPTRDLRLYSPGDPADSEVLFPEYLTYKDRSREIASHAIRWLTDRDEYDRTVGRMSQLCAKYGKGGATSRATTYILNQLRGGGAPIPRPHIPLGQDSQAESATIGRSVTSSDRS
jgi:lipid-A-disaccharide synthase